MDNCWVPNLDLQGEHGTLSLANSQAGLVKLALPKDWIKQRRSFFQTLGEANFTNLAREFVRLSVPRSPSDCASANLW